ncbi:hypothetical protein [Haloarchaeobius sp. HME9146]|uniref:hypothetical protein n=1 Tax=Haloarchaeobius sp. HME9146 TaxID=2978732 RepID=UPI0021C1816C|nr:hypothetical protein [Haloarchaeobius sp. HME9146]MCT9095412.1 hypothetical protein [Haloarchaeobius sp. HME9146]
MNVKRLAIVVVTLFLASIVAGTVQATPIAGLSEAQRTAIGIAFSTPAGLLVFGLIGSNFDTDDYLANRSNAGKFGDLVFVELAAFIVALGAATAFEGSLGSLAGWIGAGSGYFAAFLTFTWRAGDYLLDPNADDDE